MLTDKAGAVAERLSFDADGKRRETDWRPAGGLIVPLAGISCARNSRVPGFHEFLGLPGVWWASPSLDKDGSHDTAPLLTAGLPGRFAVAAVLGPVVLAHPARAALAKDWQHVMTFDGTKSLYVDLAGPRRDGEFVVMQSMFVFEPSVDLNGIDTASIFELWAYDCDGFRRAIVQFVVRNTAGVDHLWEPPTPVDSRLKSVSDDLTGLTLLGIACR